MRDVSVKAVFAALEGEPRPEFIRGLRQRLEQDWTDAAPTRPSVGDRRPAWGALEMGDVVEIRADVMERRAGQAPGRRPAFVFGIAAAVTLVVAMTLMVRSRDVEAPGDVPVTVALPSSTLGTSTTAPVTVLPPVVDVGERLRATIPVDNTADSIAIADDAVWVSGWDGQLVSRVDIDTNEVVTVDVGSPGTRVATGLGGVWVGVDGGQLVRLDPLTAEVVATIEIGGDTAVPWIGDDAVWVESIGSSRLSRIDPATNEVTGTIDVSSSGAEVQAAVVGGGSLWVSLCDRGLVSVDQQTLTVSEPIALDGCAGTLGFTDGSLWVAMDDQRTVRVDPVGRMVETVVEIGPDDGAGFMATGDDAVWVPVNTATVARIDTATNTVTEILDLGRSGQVAGLQVGHGSLWAGDYSRNTVLRIEPLL